MSAIITTKFRYQNATNLLNAIGGNGSQSPESYYLFVGRSMPWPVSDSQPTVPSDRILDENDAMQNIIAMKKITSTFVSHCIPRYNWISGTTYYEYDDQDANLYSKQFYVLTDALNLYKCIKAGAGASTIQPTGTSTTIGAPGADGYQWKYMLTLTGQNVNKFLTATYIPVEVTTDTATLQYGVQQAAVNGAIHRIKVTNGGTGYTAGAKPTITISGNGTGAVITSSDITVSNGAITEILIQSANAGQNYTHATVTITGGSGSGATARAVITPQGGHGSDAVRELGGYFVIIDTQLVADEGSGDFIVDNDFRQIGIIRNPIEQLSGQVGTAATYSALTRLTYNALSGATPTKDNYVVGQTSGASAYIDSVDSTNAILKVHQNETTGFKAFTIGETLQVGTSTMVLTAKVVPEVVLNSGEVVYIENMSPVNRNISQTEDIKLVLEM